MDKLLAIFGVLILLVCAQCTSNKNNTPPLTPEEELEAEKEEKERGKIQDTYKEWEYDESGHTTQ
jgi:hypothetical protein